MDIDIYENDQGVQNEDWYDVEAEDDIMRLRIPRLSYWSYVWFGININL